CTSVANPASFKVTRYRPGGSCNATNLPLRSVTSVRTRLVSTFRTSTSTAGRTPPLESTTVPSMTPVVIWDCAAPDDVIAIHRTTAGNRLSHRMMLPPHTGRVDEILG